MLNWPEQNAEQTVEIPLIWDEITRFLRHRSVVIVLYKARIIMCALGL